MTSPGTNSRATGVIRFPSRFTQALIAGLAFRAATALPGLAFFSESDHGVGNKQKEDDQKIRLVPDHARQNHRPFDHPRDEPSKIGEEFQERIGCLFFDLVRPILGQPFSAPRLD
jgi:hypothetical protein